LPDHAALAAANRFGAFSGHLPALHLSRSPFFLSIALCDDDFDLIT
jgi:hypothetical protein